VRNSSLVERGPAPTTHRGSSLVPKLRAWRVFHVPGFMLLALLATSET